MAAGPLTSNHVNYLIWRYLQEAGHGKTAVRLQREWGLSNPDSLPFARHIRTHALVSLVQKGLQYYEIETSLDQSGRRKSPEPSSFFFGQESESAAEEASSLNDAAADQAPSATAPSSPGKRARDSIIINNGISADPAATSNQAPAPKRARRGVAQNANAINGGTSAKSGDAMDVDVQQQAQQQPNGRRDAPYHHDGPATATNDGFANGVVDAQNEPAMQIDSSPADGAFHDARDLHLLTNGRAQVPTPAGENDDFDANEPSARSPSPAAPPALPPPQVPPLPPPPPPPIISTLQNGRSQGVQSENLDPVRYGGAQASVLDLAGKNVTFALWNPHDPALLAAAGDSLCRIWAAPSSTWHATAVDASATDQGHALSRGGSSVNGDASGNGHVAPQPAGTSVDLLEFMAGDHDVDRADIFVTALAWHPDGKELAVASRVAGSSSAAAVHLFDSNGGMINQLEHTDGFVLGLFYNATGNVLLGIGGDAQENTSLTTWNLDAAERVESEATSRRLITGAAWLNDVTIAICGHGFVTFGSCSLLDSSLAMDEDVEAVSLDPADSKTFFQWTSLAHDPYSSTIVVAAEGEGALGVIYDDAEKAKAGVADSAVRTSPTPAATVSIASRPILRVLPHAHDAEITGLQFQPLARGRGLRDDTPRLLATSSKDGTVKIWDANANARSSRNATGSADDLGVAAAAPGGLALLHTLVFDDAAGPSLSLPALAMQFSPDGHSLAAATVGGVLVWGADALGRVAGVWDLRDLGPGQSEWRHGQLSRMAQLQHQHQYDLTNGVNGCSHDGHGNGHGHAQVNGVVTNGVGVGAGTGVGEGPHELDEELDAEQSVETLSWSAKGKRLAYGCGEQIAILDLTK